MTDSTDNARGFVRAEAAEALLSAATRLRALASDPETIARIVAQVHRR